MVLIIDALVRSTVYNNCFMNFILCILPPFFLIQQILAIYGPMIYTSPANPLRGQVGGVGPWKSRLFWDFVKWLRAVRRVQVWAQSLHILYWTVASAVNLNHKTYKKSAGNCNVLCIKERSGTKINNWVSSKQCSGSGSTGSTCFRASWIRIRIH